MQAPPALSLDVTRFGVWRVLRLALAASACAVAAAWATHPHAPVAHAGWLPWLTLAAAAGLWRPAKPFRLTWDCRHWRVDGQPVRLDVAIDAGHWLLLRARPVGPRPARWLPVQRRGHEAGWHALRCAVHGARPAADRPREPW